MTLTTPRNASKRTGGTARGAAWVLIAAVVGSACEGVLGGIELSESEAPPAAGQTPAAPQLIIPPLLPAPAPVAPSSSERPEVPGAGAPLVPPPAASSDAGAAGSGSGGDAAATTPPPEPEPPRAVTVEAPAQLSLVGFTGGGPRLGTCQDGIMIGVRPTANPSTDTFGQRLVFIEPICARASVLPGSAAPAAPRIAVSRDDALLSWDTTEPLLGSPSWELPDERLVWVPQPETLCPDAAPALVGFSGAYDPAPDDGSATAILRSLVLECAPLAIAGNGVEVGAAPEGHLLISRADSFSATGSAEYRSACEGGSVLSQLLIHSGFWLDGFALGCSALRSEGGGL